METACLLSASGGAGSGVRLDRPAFHGARRLNPTLSASSAHPCGMRFQQIALGQHAAQIRSQTAFEDEDDDEYEDETEPA
jgi:hypothetical protein